MVILLKIVFADPQLVEHCVKRAGLEFILRVADDGLFSGYQTSTGGHCRAA
jgi:hypothetical protein